MRCNFYLDALRRADFNPLRVTGYAKGQLRYYVVHGVTL